MSAASSSPAAGSTRWCRSATPRWTDRTIVEWDKDDLDALGILKVDVLALGMLTCLRRAFELIEKHYGLAFRSFRHRQKNGQGFFALSTIPKEDPAVYA